MERQTIDRIDRRVIAAMAAESIPGLSLATLQGAETMERTYGAADIAGGRAVTPATRFGFGSCTKAFTSLAVCLLADEGRLKLTDPIAKHLPLTIRHPAGPITAHHLMSHSSGIPNLRVAEQLIGRHIGRPRLPLLPVSTTEDLYRLVNAAGGELCAPGERFLYFNGGYALLAELVSTVAGEPFHLFVSRKILEPLALDHTGFNTAGGDVATGYTTADGRFDGHGQLGAELLHGPGGLIGTAGDLIRFAAFMASGGAVDGNQLAPPEMIERMTEIHIELPPGGGSGFGETGRAGYGYGLRIWESFLGSKLIMHAGSTGVSGALLLIIPERKTAVALLANVGSAPMELAMAVLAECLAMDPDEVLPATRRQEWFRRISGEYTRYAWQGAVEVRAADGLVTVRDRENGELRTLIPAEDCFSSGLCYHYDRHGGRTVCQFITGEGPPVLYFERNRYVRADEQRRDTGAGR